MKKYKYIENGFIPYVGESLSIPYKAVEIDQAEYDRLIEAISHKPEDTLESVYRFSENGEYVACTRTHDETVDWYTEKVMAGEIELSEIPEDYQVEVEENLPQSTQSKEYQAGYDQAVLDLMELEV